MSHRDSPLAFVWVRTISTRVDGGKGRRQGISYVPKRSSWGDTVVEDRKGASMTEVKGFLYPRTAWALPALIPAPPWFYSGDLLTVEYRTDPAKVEAAASGAAGPRRRRPGRRRARSGPTGSPARPRGKSCSTRCGRSTRRRSSSCAAPTRADRTRAASTSGSTRTSRSGGAAPGLPEEARLDVADPSAPVHPGGTRRSAPGGMFGATLAAGDRRLADAVLTLREELGD